MYTENFERFLQKLFTRKIPNMKKRFFVNCSLGKYMKKLSGVVLFICSMSGIAYAESCDIEKLIGAKADVGTYKINVKRESQDMYKITGQEIYIKTRYCYEYSYSQDAILEINSSYGYSIGQIHFLN